MSFRDDVVDAFGRCDTTITLAPLTEMLITCQDEWSEFVPACAVTSLMSRLATLVLLPALIAMFIAIA